MNCPTAYTEIVLDGAPACVYVDPMTQLPNWDTLIKSQTPYTATETGGNPGQATDKMPQTGASNPYSNTSTTTKANSMNWGKTILWLVVIAATVYALYKVAPRWFSRFRAYRRAKK